MPCYTQNLISIELKAENIELILQTLKEMNLSPYYNKKYNTIGTSIGTFYLDNKKVSIDKYYMNKFNQFKVNYSKNVLKLATKKTKWTLKKDNTKKNEYLAIKY